MDTALRQSAAEGSALVPSTPAAVPPKKLQTKVGKVVSDKMDKTVVIVVDTLVRHRLYHHTSRRSKKFHAHDEHNEAKMGDVVRIVTCRPVSRHKHWRLVEILRRGDVPSVKPSEV